MSASVGGGDQVDVNLTPLLDLVLQLIMFFMITVNFVQVDQFDERVTLPVAQSAVPLEANAQDYVFLNLDAKGQLVGALDNLSLDTPEKLKAHLVREKENLERVARAKGKQGDIKIVIVLRADKDCRYRDVWQVIDSCQRAGFRRWQLRVMTKAA